MPTASSSSTITRDGGWGADDVAACAGGSCAGVDGLAGSPDAPADRLGFFRDIRDRMTCLWQFKILIAAVLLPVFNVPYFLLQRVPVRPPVTLELTWVDRAIPFDPRWTWVYMSFYPFIPLTALVANDARDLLRYLVGMAMMAAIAAFVFACFPVAGPRPPLPADAGLYAVLVRLDTPVNSFPSLHVGMAVFPLLFGWDVLRSELPRGARLFMLTLTVWGVVICYSTLPTKQHYAVDVAAGAALACACYAASRQVGRGDVRPAARMTATRPPE